MDMGKLIHADSVYHFVAFSSLAIPDAASK
jgi:hypothetical protein